MEAYKILQSSKDSNLPIDLGLWIGGDLQENNLEIQRALEILKEYPNRIQSVIVWKRGTFKKRTWTFRIICLYRFYESHTKNLTTAETWDIWKKSATS